MTSVSHFTSRLIRNNLEYQFSFPSMKINDKNDEREKTKSNEDGTKFEDSSPGFLILNLELFSSTNKKRFINQKFDFLS
jgi:hypothetical protein